MLILKKTMSLMLITILVGLCFIIYRFYALGIESQQGDNLNVGLVNDTLRSCGPKPNCVSSLAEVSEYSIEGYTLNPATLENFQAVVKKLALEPEVTLETLNKHYAHLTFRSKLFGFVDDLELLLNTQTGLVAVRSESRVGHSDLGANAQRVERIRQLYFTHDHSVNPP